jgi:hypothetical protein
MRKGPPFARGATGRVPSVYTIVLTHGSALVGEDDARRAAAAFAAGGPSITVHALSLALSEPRRVEIDMREYRGIIEHEGRMRTNA